ncbi:hypothetical protein LSTR_LSTR007034 [Laodelphax striatellus]|uniref:Helicase C-terminal domain-containing protein n=1 Tax=Laodelphax striatellus TaxID=195883 RepID=A0A482WK86_LAOST|nr:hypothetical protein LSTR_LSTR007034 [Laodelphax striatellus]
MESIDIDTRESIEREFQRFISNNELSEYTFTSYFTAPERIYIHNKAKWLDIMSKSRGKGMNRRVTIYKQNRSSIIQRDATFELSLQSHRMIASLLDQVPLTSPHNVLPLSEPDRSVTPGLIQRRNVNRLMHGVPIVPGMIQRQWVQGGNNVAAIRQMLPIHALRDPIVQTIDDYQVVIISGEKGCGKTTQVPQYIMEQHALMDRPCRIVCSQPRRIAAVAMAERVAQERNCRLGTEVGFQIRHESLASDTSALTCITNELLLHTLMGGDSTLETVTHLILDDIHIRNDVNADLILAIIDRIQSSNQYGDILIFLPGYEEIVSMMDKLGKRAVKPNEVQMWPVALHSKMDTREQYRVLKPAPYRKVILSTNLAESWIMLHNVVFVIDTGLVRGGEIGVGARTEPCSQLCVRQRSACAGRTPAGACYHLFSSSDYKRMAPERQPEILRTPLQNFCLQTKLLAQGNIADFMAQTLDPPSSTVVDESREFLKTIDALGNMKK